MGDAVANSSGNSIRRVSSFQRPTVRDYARAYSRGARIIGRSQRRHRAGSDLRSFHG